MPASRTVRFIISADASQYQQVLSAVEQSGGRLAQTEQRVGQSVGRTTQQLHSHGAAGREAFLVVGQAMDATGAKVGPLATAFYRIDMIFDAMEQKGSRVSKMFTAIGVAGLATGGAILAASAREQTATADLQSAVEDAGKTWADYRGELINTARAQAQFGTSQTTALSALATLTRASQDPTKAMHDLSLAQDLAAAAHIPLTDAAQQIASVYGGSTRILKQFGINVKDLVNPEKELTKAQHDQASAAAAMTSAQQHLSDVRARVAAAEQQAQDSYQTKLQSAMDAEQSADQRVADSTQRLADARQNLRDVEQRVHDATTLTIADLHELRDANQSYGDVQSRIASGELTGQAAYMAKRDALQHLNDVEEQQRQKSNVTLEQQREIRKAHEAVTKALIAENRAREKQAETHEKVQAVRAAGPGGISLSLKQEEAAAERSYQKAQARVAAASREMAKARADQAAFPSQVQHILDEVNARVQGDAKRQADTLSGWLREQKAKLENWLGGLGTGVGTAVTAVSTGVLAISVLADSGVGKMIGKALGKIGLLRPAMASADAAIVAESEATGVAADAALGPVGWVIAGIGLALVLLSGHWHQIWNGMKKAWDVVWGFIKRDWKEVALFLTGGLGIYELYKHWHSVWGAIRGVVQGVVNFMIDAFNGLTKIVLSPINLLIDAVNLVIGAIDHIHFKAPSWLGGWSFGINIPKIPHLDFSVGHVSFAGSGGTHSEGPIIHGLGGAGSTGGGGLGGGRIRGFAMGGVVPGPVGAPQLILAHGGEEVRTYADRVRGGDGISIDQLIVQVTAPTVDEQTAYKVGRSTAKGVLDELRAIKRGGNPTLSGLLPR